MKKFIWWMLFIGGSITVMVMFIGGKPSPSDQGQPITIITPPAPPATPARPVVRLIHYDVFDQGAARPGKAWFDVAVGVVDGRLPSESELRAVSEHLTAPVRSQVDRVFVTFWLPGMEWGAGAFATAHSNPGMRVSIQTGTIERYCSYRHLLSEDEVVFPGAECVGDFPALKTQAAAAR